MKTTWDYTELAEAYVKRPRYADDAIDAMCSTAELRKGDTVCDIGAGTGILTMMLLERGYSVVAIEPNDAMRNIGIRLTEGQDVKWREGTGEETGLEDSSFGLLSFGSSFNTTDRQATLREASRILRPGGWFACMWNHRDLEDPVQKGVEDIIKKNVAEYGYGTRREDQTEVINESGLFGEVKYIEGSYTAKVPVSDYVEAWRSHATLQRQAGDKFHAVIAEIEAYLGNNEILDVPYTTRLWMARVGK